MSVHPLNDLQQEVIKLLRKLIKPGTKKGIQTTQWINGYYTNLFISPEATVS